MSAISDSDLVAYVDGELDGGRASAIERALPGDADLLRRVQILRATSEWVRAAFGGEAERPAPAAVARQATPRPSWRNSRWAMPMAASLAALAIGLGGGYTAAVHWRIAADAEYEAAGASAALNEIIAYYRVFAQDARNVVERGAGEKAYIESWLGGRLQRPLRVPDLAAQGLNFRGARLVALEEDKPGHAAGFVGVPSALLVYERPNGAAVAVSISFARSRADTEPASLTDDDLYLVHWVRSGYRYALMGTEGVPSLLALAPELARQLDKF